MATPNRHCAISEFIGELHREMSEPADRMDSNCGSLNQTVSINFNPGLLCATVVVVITID